MKYYDENGNPVLLAVYRPAEGQEFSAEVYFIRENAKNQPTVWVEDLETGEQFLPREPYQQNNAGILLRQG